jgi:3',5'-cyclic AMP phosphodiesterase CpdA
MKLAHISDLHILPPGRETAANGLTSQGVATAIADDLIAISEGLDLVVVSGDLTDEADAESFAIFERIFSRIALPVVVVPGNHDGPSGMREYLRTSPVLAGWDISNRVIEIGGTRILGLDTCIDNLTQGALDAEAIALTEEELARTCDSRLIVVMHHPPLILGLETFDGFCRIARGDDLLGILGAADRDILVLSGHVHRPYTARAGNLSCFVAGSMIAPYDSHLPFGDHPIRPAPPQDFYFIHDIARGGRHVVTPQRVRGLASVHSDLASAQ